ncbi:hypothetical protein, partial [Xanthobacter autotrophicus]|uniref:hypothetical protein n=1 Tax=Xanthobacter autotrophicus TaxID=280 RepID=UPI00372C3AC0
MSQNATTSNGASDFVNSLGVSTKSSDYIDAYKNASLVINALDYLNITLVRDSYSQYGQGKEVVDALAAAGIRTDLVVEDYVVSGGEAGLDAYIAALKAFVAEHPGSLIAVEGPNEVNSATFTYNGLTSTEAITAFQRDLYTAIKSDPELSSVVVYNTSVADNSATYSTLGDLGAYSDAANVHAYPNTGRSPDAQMEAAFARAQSASTGDPIVVTETGYSTLSSANGIGTNEDAQAKLILQNMLDAYEDGAGQIYLYELLDTPTLGTGDKPQEASFGLFNADGTPKLAATAIHNLTTILSFGNDGSASTAQDTEFTLTGAPASTHSMVLTKSGDVYDIVVWSDVTVWDDVNDKEIVNPTTTVTVNLGETVTSVRIYDPLNGLTPIATYTNVSSFTIPVSDHPLVIEVGASAAAQETTTTVDSQLTLTSAEFVAQMDKLAQADGLTAVTLTDSHVLDLASVETMQYVTANYGDLLAKIDGGVTFSVSYGQASWRTELLFDANGIQTDRIEYNINNGAVTAKTDYHQDGTIEYYNYVIAGQTYTSQHQVADATGKIVLIERFHADGTLDYIKAVSSDSTQQITTYNAAGQKLSDITIAPDGARTTDSYDPSTGNIIQEIVDSSTEYTTRSYMDGVLTKVISTSKVTGYTDHYLYYVIGQTYTTQHQLIDANGKIWLIERFHADGTLDYTKTISADGTQDTVIYNAAGQKVSEIIIAPNGDRTTDTFDPTDGGLIQETVDTGASSTTDYFINGLLIKTVSINKIENVSDYYYYGITGQAYTSQHQQVDAAGRITLIERWHADGTLDYTKTVAADGTQDTVTYNSVGQKILEVVVSSDGTTTTDTYDSSTGNIIQEIVDSSATYTTRIYTNGVLTKLSTLTKSTGYTDTFTYNITGQTYTSQHVVTDSSGKIWLTERFHADGTLDYTKSVSADGAQDTVTYNAAGQKVGEVLVSSNGTTTTDTFDPSTGKLTQETVDTSATSTTKYWTDGVLMKMVALNLATNVSDFYYYNISGQTYTSQHQQVDATGKITLIERWHADGTLDYTKTFAADGTQDTVTYNSEGNKISEVIISSSGVTTTDTYDPSTGKITLEVVDSSINNTTRNYTGGVLMKVTTLTKATGYADVYTYNIVGQTYTSQHIVTDSSGKVWLTERFHADGTRDYTKAISADGTQDTVTYNAAGQKVSEVIIAPNGDKTTDTFDAASGKLTQATVDTSTTSTTKYWTDGVLMKTVAINKASGLTDYYYYNISGQTYTTQHQQVDSAGKITLIERWHADGTLDYTKMIASDGTTDTVTYNSAGKKITDVIVAPDGTKTTDTFDASTGKITLEVVDSSTAYTTRNYASGVLTKVTTLNKVTGYTDTYTYNIAGQTYSSQHIVTDSTGKVWLTERWHADGTLDYTKTVAADGATDTLTYNTAGQKVSEIIVAANGDKTTNTFDAASGKLTQATVDTSATSTTKYWTDGVLMKVVAFAKTTGTTDYYNYNISGQSYTTQHQQVDSAGKITMIERWHADGTLDYTKTIAANGATDTVTYNSAGKKIGEVIVASDGTKTTDTYDAATGFVTQEIVDSSTLY